MFIDQDTQQFDLREYKCDSSIYKHFAPNGAETHHFRRTALRRAIIPFRRILHA